MAANLAARRARLLGGSAVALVAALVGPRGALALDECGAAAPGGTVTCTPAGNTFPSGIQYKVDDLTIVVQDGVVIDTTGKAGEPGGVVSGGNGDYGNLTVKVGTTAGSGVTITTNENDADGISVATNDGSATITSFADITTSFKNGDALSAKTTAGDISISSTGDLDVDGFYGHGIRALSDTGKITITHTGDIETYGTGGFGIRAITKNDIDITVEGDITVRNSAAILAQASAGNVTLSMTGDVNTKDDNSPGLQATAKDGIVHLTHVGSITTLGEFGEAIDAEGYKGVEISFTGEISTADKNATGIAALSKAGGISIESNGDITVAGYGSRAISAVAEAEILITSVGELTTGGTYGDGIFASSTAGSITISHSGDISTKGNGGGGIDAFANDFVDITSKAIITVGGQAHGIDAYSVTKGVDVVSTGNITTAADNSDGINAFAKAGDVIVVSTGNIVTAGDGSGGIAAQGVTGATIYSTGNIITSGDFSSGLFTSSAGDVARVFNTGNIATSGESANGIAAYGAAYVKVVSVGDISTTANDTEAIIAVSENESVEVRARGTLSTAGGDADGIFAYAKDNDVEVVAQGLIQVTGLDSVGINVLGDEEVEIDAENVRATGKDGYAMSANSTTSTVAITVRGSVLGGYDDGAGIFVAGDKGSRIETMAGGAVGALSDFAVENDKDALTVYNRGAITGSFFFEAGDDQLNNLESGRFDLRQFADTNGDLTRDTEGVALGNFGANTDSFNNNGVLRLAGATGATTWNTTDQILHPGGGNSDITQEGVEQGFITNLETFDHRGLITLRDGTAGDLLVITDQADGKTKGAGVFRSNGGSLALDVVLDDGSSKQSDVLILDKAVTGGLGATRVAIANAGGLGGETSGDGILVINVRDKSDSDAFASAAPAIAGAYQYDLVFQNAAKTDQNWYLQSSFFEGSLEYPAIGGAALASWQSGAGSLHDQIRARRAQTEAQEAALGQVAELPTGTDMADTSAVRLDDSGGNAGWFRVSGSDLDIGQDGPADFNLNTTRAEAGLDVGFDNVLSDDWLVAGAFAGYGWASAGFDSGSEIDFDIASVGAYATYFRGPYYVDALVKLDWLDGTFNSAAVSQDGDVSLPVFGLSLESGYRFDLTPDGLYLQPQAQLSYAHAGDDSFTDDSGVKIKLEEADSLRGRLGARIGQELRTTAGAAAEPVRGNFYLEAAVNQEFLGETEAKVSGLTLEQELPETTFEIGAGIDIALPKDGISFTVDADYIFGEEADGVSATGGFRLTW